MKRLFALVGNQNSGKSTLFNRLTGSSQHVGNFPGVTVEKKEGAIKGRQDALAVDLPGIYSLSPYTAEEKIALDFILKERPDAIINIVDATSMERSLYLSLQLMELELPMVIALNMMDEVQASGSAVDTEELSQQLGVPVVPISAGKNQGIGRLVDQAVRAAAEKMQPLKSISYGGPTQKAICRIQAVIERQAAQAGLPLPFAAAKLAEGDEAIAARLGLDQERKDRVQGIVEEMEVRLGTDREAALADMRYTFIQKLCAACVTKSRETREQIRSKWIDKILTNRWLGIPIFFGIMLTIFWLTFTALGAPLQRLLEEALQKGAEALDGFIASAGASRWVRSLVIDGICAGVGSVVSFLPVILLLFFFLSLLEDSGYMARAAFLMERPLRKIGLSGRSCAALLIGFGCSVPAILSTRTLSCCQERRMTILLIPFMSCSAKLPVYGIIITAFFPAHRALVMILIYLIGIAAAVLSGLLLKDTAFRGEPPPFVMELPAYRLPSPGNVLLRMWEKAKDFLRKAFTVIFAASIVIWFLQSFDPNLRMTADSSQSILARLGAFLAPALAPLGISDWRASAALISGITAKESVVSTLTVLTGAAADTGLSTALSGIFTPLSAFSFLVFTLLYTPCIAAFAASRRELGSTGKAILNAAYQTAAAYVAALAVYQIGSLFLQ